jgi:hypothetical protein
MENRGGGLLAFDFELHILLGLCPLVRSIGSSYQSHLENDNPGKRLVENEIEKL